MTSPSTLSALTNRIARPSCFHSDFWLLTPEFCLLTSHFAKSLKAAIFYPMSRLSQKKTPVKLDDKQSERDTRELRIDKVGVRGLRFPIQVRDKARAFQNTVATIGMFVDLPKEFKGTHMSRFVEVLNAHGNVIHVENISDILL